MTKKKERETGIEDAQGDSGIHIPKSKTHRR